VRTLVGLDIGPESSTAAVVAAYKALAARFPDVEFYRVSPSPAGPYVIRSELIERTNAPLILFHDSDDMSCADRVEKLAPALGEDGVGLVGSHELRLDELTHRLVGERYPLDVNRALSLGPGHVQLHPSTIIRREVYERIGGFSTNTRFGADTQLLLRAFFYTKIRNVDDFLYIRRRHPDALTVNADTGNGTPARFRLEAPWRSDFARVLSGGRKLGDSSLRRIGGQTSHEFKRVFGSV